MDILIVGAGKIGCFVTAQFSLHTQHRIHLLARSNWTALRDQGITITDVPKNIEFHTNKFILHNAMNTIPACDIVILALHTSQNSTILPHLKSACSANARIITLQNGLSFEDDIINSLNLTLYSGTCWIKVSALGPAHVRRDFGFNLKLGRYEKNKNINLIQPNDFEIKNLFEPTQLEVDLVDNIQSVQLTKLALNIPFFIIAAQEKQSFSQILVDTELDECRKIIQAEIIEMAKQLSSPVDISFIEKIIANLRKMPLEAPPEPEKFSANLRKELPLNIDPLLKLAQSHHIKLPVLTSLYTKGLQGQT